MSLSGSQFSKPQVCSGKPLVFRLRRSSALQGRLLRTALYAPFVLTLLFCVLGPELLLFCFILAAETGSGAAGHEHDAQRSRESD